MKKILSTAGLPVAGSLLIALAVWQIGALILIFASRLDYPMDIEWMEGGVLLHVHRLLSGNNLYPPQNEGFLPFPYPPLHYYAIALASLPFELDYWIGRLVSVIFIVTACGVLYRQVRSQADSGFAGMTFGLVAVALAVSCFPATGGWFDLVRNDSMALALPIGAAALLYRTNRWFWRLTVGGVLLAASIFTKQTGIFFIGWILLFVFVRDWRKGLQLLVLTATLCGAFLAWLLWSTEGYYWLYTVTMLAQQALIPRLAIDWLRRILGFMPYLPVVPLLAIWLLRHRGLRARSVLWLGMLVAAVPASILPYIKEGGYLNNLMPVMFLGGPVIVLLVQDLLLKLNSRNRLIACAFFVPVAAWLLIPHSYSPGAKVPGAEARAKAIALNKFIAELQGGVLIPNHPFLAIRNGHPTPQFHDQSYVDAIVGRLTGLDLSGFLARTDPRWVILSSWQSGYAPEGQFGYVRSWINLSYEHAGRIPSAVPTLIGFYSEPRLLMKRRSNLQRRKVRRLGVELAGQEWVYSGNAFSVSPDSGAIRSSLSSAGTDSSALSPPFLIDRNRLGFLMSGGTSGSISLLVGNDEVYTIKGINSDSQSPVVWDLHEYYDQRARIRIDDAYDGGRDLDYIDMESTELFDY